MKKEKMISRMTIVIQDLNKLYQLDKTIDFSKQYSPFHNTENYILDDDNEYMKIFKQSAIYSAIQEIKKDPRLYLAYQKKFGRDITACIERILPKTCVTSDDAGEMEEVMSFWED